MNNFFNLPRIAMRGVKMPIRGRKPKLTKELADILDHLTRYFLQLERRIEALEAAQSRRRRGRRKRARRGKKSGKSKKPVAQELSRSRRGRAKPEGEAGDG